MKKYIIIFITTILAFYLLAGAILVKNVESYNSPATHTEEGQSVRLEFPDDFLWGAATASYQIEGGNYNSNWWKFEKEGRIQNNDSAEIAADHYNRYDEDFALLEEFNLNGYRMSIEWSRIEPERGVFDPDEIEHYRKMLTSLNERGIKPIVVLWHFSVPQWFEDEGGWGDSNSVKYFTEYAEYVAGELGNEDELWITMNEPVITVTCGYILGKFPPGESRITKIPAVVSNMIQAHRSAYDVIHKVDPTSQVSIDRYISNLKPINPDSFIDKFIVYVANYLQTEYFMNRTVDKMDFMGVHYYYAQDIGLEQLFEFKTLDASMAEDLMRRYYYPRGLYEVLMDLKKYELPIYITEIGTQDNGYVSRNQFIREHAVEVYHAIQDGVDVKGFFYWSLLDNFEWSEGYTPKFGLVSVDPETQDRTVKDDALGYLEIAGCNCVGGK